MPWEQVFCHVLLDLDVLVNTDCFSV